MDSPFDESEPEEAEGVPELSSTSQESAHESSNDGSQSEGEVVPPRPQT